MAIFKSHHRPRVLDQVSPEIKTNTLSKHGCIQAHHELPTLQIMYYNILSLQECFDHIKTDPSAMLSDIILTNETWCTPGDFLLDDFHDYYLDRDMSFGGLTIYVKDKWNPLVEAIDYNPDDDNGVHVMVLTFNSQLRIAVVHVSPEAFENDVLYAIHCSLFQFNDCKTLLVGNFNITEQFCYNMNNTHRLQLKNNPTTQDSVFSDVITNVTCVYENDNLPLSIQVPLEKVYFHLTPNKPTF